MPAPANPRHVLIYEPCVDGHHVGWLRFMTEDLLAAGISLTLALDTRPVSFKRIESHMADLLPKVTVMPALAADGAGKLTVARVADCLKQSGAALAFMAHFNDIASKVVRRAAFGSLPDKSLRGRLGGIYLRPRFLNGAGFSLNELIKKMGFNRLVRNDWLNPLLLLDPTLCEAARRQYPGAPVYLLADPYPEHFQADRAAARRQFNLPDDKFVFLFYGGDYKRKGLHLVAEAMLKMSAPGNAYLLCAGLQPKDGTLVGQLESLQSQGRAQIRNHFVFAEEEKQLFAASDAILLPYIHHQGTSAVLSRAAGAGKPVIASDEYFIGQTVRQYNMGLLFETENVPALGNALTQLATARPEELAVWRTGAEACGRTCSREVFRSALVGAIEAALKSIN